MAMKQAPGSGYLSNFIIVVILLKVFVLATCSSIDGYDDQLKAEIKADFEEIDTNKDGFLTIGEFVDATYASIVGKHPFLAENPDLSTYLDYNPGGASKFASIDTNKDGRLSPGELKAVMRDAIRKVFMKVDANGDDFFTFGEFFDFFAHLYN